MALHFKSAETPQHFRHLFHPERGTNQEYRQNFGEDGLGLETLPPGWSEIRENAWQRADGAEIYRRFGRAGRQSFMVMRADRSFIRTNHYRHGEGQGGTRIFRSLTSAIAALSQ